MNAREFIDRYRDELTEAEWREVDAVVAFWSAFPQTDAVIDPYTWSQAERMRQTMIDEFGLEMPVRDWAEWLRVRELFDTLACEEPSPT